MKKKLYTFGNGNAEGNISMKSLLGGKGANLAEMCRLKLPIPPGFTITTDVCKDYYDNNCELPNYFVDEIDSAVSGLEELTHKKLGDKYRPLLLSVRSGARSSMPGMMDTILNLGINATTITGISDQRFARDSYRRFLQMYGSVVLNIHSDQFEKIISNIKHGNNIYEDTELSSENLLSIIRDFKNLIQDHQVNFTEDPKQQLYNAIKAVFDSWMSKRAITYRKINNIPDCWGTAVNVQVMVFGNMNDESGSGVAFTRNPSTGANEVFGEYLINAQGEDVVAGIRTPKLIANDMQKNFPVAYESLMNVATQLERHYSDMQDIEFTIEDSKLWLLQTRSAKRTAKAAVKVAMDMLGEGLINKQEALMMVEPSSLEQLIHPVLDTEADCKIIARGLPASPGAASGIVVFSNADAVDQVRNGRDVILVRKDTSPEDIEGMNSAVGILTTCGGMTSHAAVVSRGMGKVCICGVDTITIDYHDGTFTTKGGDVVRAGDIITLDGNTGRVIFGKAVTTKAIFYDEFHDFIAIANEFSSIGIRANADTVQDIKNAKIFGIDGIGLCRTEHMFFSSDRINLVRKMIIAEDVNDRLTVLNRLEEIQREDFLGIFTELGGLPITIRLLDPPLHEFLPHDADATRVLAEKIDLPYSFVNKRVNQLKETNPMLGHRGCRLGISYPEIYEMQVRAILSAATEIPSSKLEIMVPFVMNERDFKWIKNLILRVGADYSVKYSIGNMIELPSAALNANKIAEHSEFFSFGTNDLTQMTLGLSRDDSAPVLTPYCEYNILSADPFISLQQEDVGELLKIAVERGKSTNPKLKLGICGEHGGNPETVYFSARLGLDYVSCSAYRVPIARLAGAQYVVRQQEKKS